MRRGTSSSSKAKSLDSKFQTNPNASETSPGSTSPPPVLLSSVFHHQQQQQNNQQQFQSYRRTSAQTSSSSSIYSSAEQNGPLLEDEESPLDLTPLHPPSPFTFGEESQWNPRRPSTTSNNSFGSVGKNRRRSSASSHYGTPSRSRRPSSANSHSAAAPPGSPPARVPTPRSASRNKILASSAMVIEGLNSTGLPFEYRTRSASGDSNLLDKGMPSRHDSRSPNRPPQSPSIILPASKSSIMASSGGTSLAERKRRLASASGGSTFDQESLSKGSASSFYANQSVQSLTGESPKSSLTDLSRNQPVASRGAVDRSTNMSSKATEETRAKRADESKEASSTTKSSLRSRLFGIRKSSNKSQEENPEDDRVSSFSTSSTNVAGNDYGKSVQQGPSSTGLPSSSSFAASIDGKLAQSSSTSSNRNLLNVDRLDTPPSTRLRGEDSEGLLGESSFVEDTIGSANSVNDGGSWITSLASAPPPTILTFQNLDESRITSISPSPTVSPSDSRTELGRSSPEDTKKIQRTGSWPPNDRKGALISTKGIGSNKGYRFENAAASQARTSPTREKSSPTKEGRSPTKDNNGHAFLNTDPNYKESFDLPPEKKEKWANGTRLGSPAPLDIGKFDRFSPSKLQRSDSYSSARSTHTQGSPRMSSSKARPATSDDSRRGHRSTLSMSQDIQHQRPSYKRNSGSYSSSIHSQNSPTLLQHVPRSSSLQGKSPSTLNRPGSSRNSFIASISPTEMRDEIDYIEKERMKAKEKSHRSSWRYSTASMKATSAAGAAGAGAIAAIRSKFGGDSEGKGEQSDLVETRPQSMKTAKMEMSPSSFVLSADLPNENNRSLIAPANDLGTLQVPKTKQSQEPRRPTKSPLRLASTSSLLETPSMPTQISPSSSTSPQIRNQRSASSPPHLIIPHSRTTSGEQADLSRSAPRKSLEEVVQLDSVGFDESLTTANLSISPGSPIVETMSNKEIRLQPVPESAKRLGAMTRSGFELGGLSNNASNTSLVTEEDAGHGDDQSGRGPSKSFSKRYKSLRKVTPPALSNAFNRNNNKGNVIADSVTEEEGGSEWTNRGEREIGIVTPGTMSKLKTKKWMFGRDTTGETGDLETSSSSRAGIVGRSLRGKKMEMGVNRPEIRRIFDDSNQMGEGLESDDSDDDDREPIQVTSTDANMAKVDSPVASSVNQSRESSGRLFNTAIHHQNGPPTPAKTSDDLTPEAKKLVHRRNVIRELVETEKSYASDLAVVRDVYLLRARTAVGMSSSTPINTPLSNQSTPIHSPASTPSASTTMLSNNHFSHKASPLYTAHRNLQRMASSELPLPPSSPLMNTNFSAASPSSLASSSDPSNRSSTYTVSSQTSQASDSSYPFNLGNNPPPLPATPPNLAGLPSSTTNSTLQAFSPASNISTSSFSTQRNSTGKPKMNISTTSLLLNNQNGSTTTLGDVGLTPSDVRVIFSHLEACCTFAEEMASILAASMGTFARSKKINAKDVTADMDKEDDSLGETFLNMMARIRVVYINYCSRHEASMKRLQEVVNSSPKAAAFFKECTELARKQTNAWDIGSLLIKPVQRVLKYPLLIQQIIHGTSKTHVDYNNLVAAFEEIQGVADEINQVKKRKDLADQIITGRLKDSRTTSMTGYTTKGKKKSSSRLKEEEGLINPIGTEESAVEEFGNLAKRFTILSGHVQNFGLQSKEWSGSVKESYESQLSMMLAIRRLYRLQVEEEDSEGITRIKPNKKEVVSEEEKLLTAYVRLLRRILIESWHQMDQDIQTTIAPMTGQIHRMFETPRLVMLKREERQADYHRYRQAFMAGRQSDRKVLENANGFIALNAQLVEELPLFLFGVQRLLDVGVQAFARLQASFFDQVRSIVLNYWSEVAKREEDFIISADGSGLPSMRHINHVRAFWDRHSVSSAWIESLSIIRKDHLLNVSTPGSEVEKISFVSAPSTPATGDDNLANTLQFPLNSSSTERRGTGQGGSNVPASASASNGASNGGSSSNNYLLPTTGARRPSGVASLMRSLSGTFGREASTGEVPPPLPSDAALKHTPGKNLMPPSLPSLVFRDGIGEGYFIQAAPIPFLEEVQKEPYGVSPSLVTSPLPDVKKEEMIRLGSSMTRSSSEYSGISVQENPPLSTASAPLISSEEQKQSNSTTNINPPQRHRMNILYQCTAIIDSSTASKQEQQGHLGWPFLTFVKGDTYKVLSSDDSLSTSLLFGRIDRSGELGWAEKRCFSVKI